jgi:hypothetical protein
MELLLFQRLAAKVTALVTGIFYHSPPNQFFSFRSLSAARKNPYIAIAFFICLTNYSVNSVFSPVTRGNPPSHIRPLILEASPLTDRACQFLLSD